MCNIILAKGRGGIPKSKDLLGCLHCPLTHIFLEASPFETKSPANSICASFKTTRQHIATPLGVILYALLLLNPTEHPTLGRISLSSVTALHCMSFCDCWLVVLRELQESACQQSLACALQSMIGWRPHTRKAAALASNRD